jgi:hypothetical protein
LASIHNQIAVVLAMIEAGADLRSVGEKGQARTAETRSVPQLAIPRVNPTTSDFTTTAPALY